MKKLFFLIAALAVIVFWGCDTGDSPDNGAPSTTDPSNTKPKPQQPIDNINDSYAKWQTSDYSMSYDENGRVLGGAGYELYLRKAPTVYYDYGYLSLTLGKLHPMDELQSWYTTIFDFNDVRFDSVNAKIVSITGSHAGLYGPDLKELPYTYDGVKLTITLRNEILEFTRP